MIDKPPSPPPASSKEPSAKNEIPPEKISSAGSSISDRSVVSPKAAPNDYFDRVAAAMGKDKKDTGAPQKMTAENYQEIYRQQQEAMQKAAFNQGKASAEAELKQAADAKRIADAATREKHISSQIDAWKRTLGQDYETDKRTRATIEALSRELSNLKKK